MIRLVMHLLGWSPVQITFHNHLLNPCYFFLFHDLRHETKRANKWDLLHGKQRTAKEVGTHYSTAAGGRWHWWVRWGEGGGRSIKPPSWCQKGRQAVRNSWGDGRGWEFPLPRGGKQTGAEGRGCINSEGLPPRAGSMSIWGKDNILFSSARMS